MHQCIITFGILKTVTSAGKIASMCFHLIHLFILIMIQSTSQTTFLELFEKEPTDYHIPVKQQVHSYNTIVESYLSMRWLHFGGNCHSQQPPVGLWQNLLEKINRRNIF